LLISIISVSINQECYDY